MRGAAVSSCEEEGEGERERAGAIVAKRGGVVLREGERRRRVGGEAARNMGDGLRE